MRSSNKNRSRNKNGRKSLGNIVNRVFESAGPEGKVRGTPQQIIEKYLTLSRDAQTAGDRIAAENFLQHAEHYIRLLAEAQREAAPRPEAGQQPQGQQHAPAQARDAEPEPAAEPARAGGTDSPLATIETADPAGQDSGLVDTPEGRSDTAEETPETPAPRPRARSTRRRSTRAKDQQAERSDGADAAGEVTAG